MLNVNRLFRIRTERYWRGARGFVLPAYEAGEPEGEHSAPGEHSAGSVGTAQERRAASATSSAGTGCAAPA
jgi:hypothetical protein